MGPYAWELDVDEFTLRRLLQANGTDNTTFGNCSCQVGRLNV